MDVSTDSRDSIDETKGMHEACDYPEEQNLGKEKGSIILKEGSFYHVENEADLKLNDAKVQLYGSFRAYYAFQKLALYREPEMEFRESLVSKVNTSMNDDEENKFITMIQNILTNNKENKQLEEDLLKLLVDNFQPNLAIENRLIEGIGIINRLCRTFTMKKLIDSKKEKGY